MPVSRRFSLRQALAAGAAVLLVAAAVLFAIVASRVFVPDRGYTAVGVQVFTRTAPESRSRRVEYASADGADRYVYARADEEAPAEETVLGHIFRSSDGAYAVFVPAHRSAESPLPTPGEIEAALRAYRIRAAVPLLIASATLFLLSVASGSAWLVLFLKARKQSTR